MAAALVSVAAFATPEVLVPDIVTLQRMAARFVSTEIGADLSSVSPADRRVLAKLIAASQIVDALFLRQAWAGNEAMLVDLAGQQTPEGRERLHYFLLNKGPWSRLDHNLPFVPGAPSKPDGANFYPEGASKAEIETWMRSLPDRDRRAAAGFFTVVRRGTGGGFRLVPYNVEYETELTRAGSLLREAAALTQEATLRSFLDKRADAFRSNDYYESDVAWMEIQGIVEPTIGPYEVYEDELFNYKAAFESYVAVRDDEETRKLQKFAGELQDIEDHLPMAAEYRNPKLAGLAPIVVVNEIYAGGDGNRGVQTAAFNLPNDERVIREKGAKRVMLRNVQDAKFRAILLPISRVVLAASDHPDVTFEAFFTHILVHELMHGLGPHGIAVAGRRTSVRQELKETYSAVEEVKADISSLFAIQYLIDKGVLPRSLEASLYTTCLASAFRSIRFGVNEAHGKGLAIQLNYLLDRGGIVVQANGTFAVNRAEIRHGVEGLTREILTMQAEGNYDAAKAIGERLGVVRPPVQRALDKLTSVPVDIEPRFTTAEQLLSEEGQRGGSHAR